MAGTLRLRLLVAALLIAPVALTTGAASATTEASDWTEIDHAHPSEQDSFLKDAWSDGTDVWAAGTRTYEVTGVREWRTWAQRCGPDGTCDLQNTIDVEAMPSYTHLEGITGTSPTDVWVVGYAEIPFSDEVAPLVEHFNGRKWSIVETPIDAGGLYGISAASSSDVWAVGSFDAKPFWSRPLVLHWDGTAWSKDPIRLQDGCRGWLHLRDVDATGPRPLAVGACRHNGRVDAMIIGRQADGWHREKIKGIDPSQLDLVSVDWTGNQAWAGGRARDGQGVVLQLRHGRWTRVPVPPEVGRVYGFSGTDENDVWGVGVIDDFSVMTMHWDGTAWTLVDSPANGWLESVTHTADGTPWAVGNKRSLSLIQRYDGPLAPLIDAGLTTDAPAGATTTSTSPSTTRAETRADSANGAPARQRGRGQ